MESNEDGLSLSRRFSSTCLVTRGSPRPLSRHYRRGHEPMPQSLRFSEGMISFAITPLRSIHITVATYSRRPLRAAGAARSLWSSRIQRRPGRWPPRTRNLVEGGVVRHTLVLQPLRTPLKLGPKLGGASARTLLNVGDTSGRRSSLDRTYRGFDRRRCRRRFSDAQA
jgi:hypothetical protein